MDTIKKEVVILATESNNKHFLLLKKRLRLAGVLNKIVRLVDGQEVMDFLLMRGRGAKRNKNNFYLLLFSFQMHDIDGVEQLRNIRRNKHLKNIPVIVLTRTFDRCERELCSSLGCIAYMVKPVDGIFARAVHTVCQSLSQHSGDFRLHPGRDDADSSGIMLDSSPNDSTFFTAMTS